MGTGQQSVLINMAGLVVGDLYLDGPHRAQPGVIDNSGGGSVGLVFTQVSGSDGHCILGGTIGPGTPFFGILSNPKVYALYGSGGNALAPSIVVPQYGKGEFVYDTTGIAVSLPGACNVGDKVDFNTTTGALITRSPQVSFTGAVTSNVLTVSAVTTGSAPIQVGGTYDTPGGVMTIVSLGTGTGGTGTYNVDDVANFTSALIVGNSAPASGNNEVPGFTVQRFNLTSAGTGVIGNIN